MSVDYYEVLGVSKSATQEDIKKAYRAKMLEVHPDRNADDPECLEKSKKINEAYSILSDVSKRELYDRGPQTPFPFDMSGFDFGGFGPFSRNRSAPRKGQTVGVKIPINLYEAISGAEKEVSYSYTTECTECGLVCSTCNGSGVSVRVAGNMMTSFTCNKCSGRGKVFSGCSLCSQGQVKKDRVAKINISPGLEDGDRIGLAGAGLPGENGGPNGDLIAQVSIRIPKKETFTEEQVLIIKELFS